MSKRIHNLPPQKPFRKILRNSLTAAEAVLWKSLQRRQLLGKKFRRQVSIGRYIVDFYCPECGLIVELDGADHFSIFGGEYDLDRTKYLENQGLKVIRFENQLLLDDLAAVLDIIKQNLKKSRR